MKSNFFQFSLEIKAIPCVEKKQSLKRVVPVTYRIEKNVLAATFKGLWTISFQVCFCQFEFSLHF